jgi:hypothetical protein
VATPLPNGATQGAGGGQAAAGGPRPAAVQTAGVQTAGAQAATGQPAAGQSAAGQAAGVAAVAAGLEPGLDVRDLLDGHFGASPPVGWPNDPGGTVWFSEGGARLFARRPGAFVAVRAPLNAVPGDVVVSGTFRKVGGPPGGGYGLIVRDQGTNPGDGIDQSGRYVVAEVGDMGEYGIWRREEDHWVDLIPWSRSDAVRTGGSPNELSLRALGDEVAFVVNGAQIGTANVRFREGGVGLFAGGDRNEVLVDRFRVQAIVQAAPARRGP